MMPNARILIVDDEKNIRLTIAQSLDPLGYEVMTALNGEDALKQLQAQEYDLILLDLRMPGMDGLEVLQRAVEMHPDIQIVILSAHGTVDNAVEAMKLGAVDFLQKPFTPQELRGIVHQVLEHDSLNTQESSSYQGAMKIAKHCARKRQFDKAIAHAKQAIGCDPSRAEAFNLLGEFQEIEGDRIEALKNYRVATDLDPTYKPAQNNLTRATRSPKSRPPLIF
jgi:DNA-binding NtrC family response regulator